MTVLTISIVLFSSVVSSAFNVYATTTTVHRDGAAKGGSATSGQATGGAGNSGTSTCYGTCNFYGGQADSGAATGGAANGEAANGGAPAPVTPPAPISNNNAPRAANRSITTNENTPADVDLKGLDPNHRSLVAVIVTKPSHGALSNIYEDTWCDAKDNVYNQRVNVDHCIVTYRPDEGYSGDDNFTYKVKNFETDSDNIATVNVSVSGPPPANPSKYLLH